jgi:hypothetical protein
MDNESFGQEIAKLNMEVGELETRHDELRRKYEVEQVQMARYSHLIEKKERLEREIAAMENPGHVPSDDDYDCDAP